MDALSYAINEIRHTIPPPLLNLVFSRNGIRFANNPGALDAAIRDKVIDGRVRQNVNAIGAVQIDIPLDGPGVGLTMGDRSPETYDRFTYVFEVPKTLTQNRTITSALAYSYAYNGHAGVNLSAVDNIAGSAMCGYSNVMDAVQGVAQSMMPIQVNQTARVSIVGENVILIEDYIPLPRQSYLRCLVTHDSQFSTIKPQSVPAFSTLVVLATKAYIYNMYRIELDRGFLQGGQELGEIKNTVDSYSSAEEEYQTFLRDKWRKISHMNDPARMQRFAKMITGGKG